MHLTATGATNGGQSPYLDDDDKRFTGDDFDSACSTPFVSAPSSPTRGSGAPSGYFFSAPASPVRYLLSPDEAARGHGSSDFEFSSKCEVTGSAGSGSMSSADELFLNGKIRPMKLSSHLQRPQHLTPLLDLEEEGEVSSGGLQADGEGTFMMMRGRDMRLRNRSLHRKTRSLSPPPPFEWRDEHAVQVLNESTHEGEKQRAELDEPMEEAVMSGSASSSRSSSSGGRNSKKWVFLKDLLYRSKSEGRAATKEKFWSFSPAKEKKASSSSSSSAIVSTSKSEENAGERSKKPQQKQRLGSRKPANGNVSKRRVPPSAHELHYTANRAQAEEMKKKTYLPYRQGLFGCLGFSSKGYGSLHGFTKTLNPISSR